MRIVWCTNNAKQYVNKSNAFQHELRSWRICTAGNVSFSKNVVVLQVGRKEQPNANSNNKGITPGGEQ